MTTPRPASRFLLCLLFLPCLVFGQSTEPGLVTELEKGDFISLGENVNTPGDELACFRYADKLYFSSEKKIGSKNKHATRICTALGDGAAFVIPENPKGSTKHMAHLTFDLNAERMFFVLLQKNSEGKITSSHIGCRDRGYDGTWGPQVRLPEHLNSQGHLTTHPAYGYDRSRRKEILYFASDRPGGKGGMDIWGSEVTPGIGEEEDKYGVPFNLSINTEKDDMSPFFDTRTQTLFFSSNGRRGYGGFDIYVSKINWEKGELSMPINLVEPINSESDDHSFSFHHASGLAYFSSDRLSDNCTSENCRNFDIYQTEVEVGLDLTIVNAADEKTLAGCNVELIDPKIGKVLSTHLDLTEGRISLGLRPGKAYRVMVSQAGYFPISIDVLADPLDVFSNMEKTVTMKPMRPKAVEDEEQRN